MTSADRQPMRRVLAGRSVRIGDVLTADDGSRLVVAGFEPLPANTTGRGPTGRVALDRFGRSATVLDTGVYLVGEDR